MAASGAAGKTWWTLSGAVTVRLTSSVIVAARAIRGASSAAETPVSNMRRVRGMKALPSLPSPPVGEGTEQPKAARRVRGQYLILLGESDPSPGSRPLSLRARHPLPQGG